MQREFGQVDADLLDVAGIPVSSQVTYELDGILGLHGSEFVRHAYRLLLAREPEEGGLAFYRSRLLEGTSKIQILSELASSKEALEIAVNPPGLANSLLLLRLSRLPIIGRIIGTGLGVEGDTKFDTRLRALEESLHSEFESAALAAERPVEAPLDLHALVANSPLFNAQWYKQQPPALGDDIDLVEHYLASRGIDSRSPSKEFDGSFYRSHYFDVRRSGINPLVHYLLRGPGDGRRRFSVAEATELREKYGRSGSDPAIQCIKAPIVSGEVAVLVTRAVDGTIRPYVVNFIAALVSQGVSVVLVVLATGSVELIPPEVLSGVSGLFVSGSLENAFLARAHVLHLHSDLLSSPILYLLDDSAFGPFNIGEFSRLIDRIRKGAADMVGLMVDNRQASAPSFFLAIKRRALSTMEFHRFIDVSGPSASSFSAAHAGENDLSAHLQSLGLKTELMISRVQTAAGSKPVGATTGNWTKRIEWDVPFVGVAALADADAGSGGPGLRRILADEGYDLRLVDMELGRLKTPVTGTGAVSSSAETIAIRAAADGRRPRLKVAFIGPWNYEDHPGAASRGYVSALWHADISLNVHPIRRPFLWHGRVGPTIDCRSYSGDTDIAIVNLNPDLWAALLTDDNWEIISRARRVVGAWACEADKAPATWYPAIDVVDAIWAPTRFAADVFERSTDVPVDVVPYCIAARREFEPREKFLALRAELGIAPGSRIILCWLEGANFLERENPSGLIEAYAMSGLQKKGWLLMLGAAEGAPTTEVDAQFLEIARGVPGVHVIDKPLDHAAADALMNMADIYASAHRTGIAGQSIAKAMALGKSVVATDYGGSRDFLDSTCGFPVPYKLRSNRGALLAEADIPVLARLLRNAAVKIHAGDLSIGNAARERIRQRSSPREVVRSMWLAGVRALGI